jgi:RNA polymerase sigma-70 factor, ECF subfamily
MPSSSINIVNAPHDPDLKFARVTASDDARLVERLRQQDPAALELLIERCGRRAFALAFRVTGSAAEAEDAVQDAFLAIWERGPQLRLSGRLESLVLTIVHRRAVDRVRRRRTSAVLYEREADAQADEDAAAAIDRLLDAVAAPQLRADLRAALAALPPEQRTVLELAFLSGLTQTAIATRLAVPLGTVKSRLRLGMKRMRAHLEARGYP